MNVYFISGLGADQRAFERIHLPATYTIHYIHWIKPNKNETLVGYAHRLAEQIDKTKPFALVGLSMGGMMATAMNDFLQPKKTILISSVSRAAELPSYFSWCGKLRLYKLLPVSLMNKPTSVAFKIFGAKSETEKKLMRLIIESGDGQFVKWGIGAILTWKGKQKPANVFHIHGSKDKILPIKNIKPDVVIEGGSHFMVWTKAGEVSRLIEKELNSVAGFR